jgi:LacI family transcriptional regulator
MNDQPRATIADVARVADVAPMTVSRVLTGSAKVGPDKTKRVQNAIQMLRYQPNEMARALRGQRSRSVGLIVPRLSDSFFASISHAINDVAKDCGCSLIVSTTNDDEEVEYSQAQMMVSRGVDGIIVIPGAGLHSKLKRREFSNVQIVALDKTIDDPSIDSVVVENKKGALAAVQHLIGHGHRKIAILSESNSLSSLRARFEGYRRAVIDAELKSITCFDFTAERATQIIRDLLKKKDAPTAFFTTNGPATLHALRSLFELGIGVPDRVALIGFDDFELADLLKPSLTVVRQPARELGRIAATCLFDRLQDGDANYRAKTIVLPVELVIRQSCGCV